MCTGEQSGALILDEPTTGLDKDSRDHFYALVREARGSQFTVLLITHDMAALDALACRWLKCLIAMFMVAGRVMAPILRKVWE